MHQPCSRARLSERRRLRRRLRRRRRRRRRRRCRRKVQKATKEGREGCVRGARARGKRLYV